MASLAAFLLASGAVLGFALLCATGANDVSNAMGTAVGSGALSFRRAVLVAAVFELLGASLVGGAVENTIQRDFVDVVAFGSDARFAVGMCAAIAGTLLWVSLATVYAIPVSTTHAIVGSVVGFTLAAGQAHALNGVNLGKTVTSWVVSPLLGAAIAALLYYVLRRTCLAPPDRVRRMTLALPYLFGLNVATDVLFVLVGGPPMLRPEGMPPATAALAVFLPALLGAFLLATVAGHYLVLPYCERAMLEVGDTAQVYLLSELEAEEGALEADTDMTLLSDDEDGEADEIAAADRIDGHADLPRSTLRGSHAEKRDAITTPDTAGVPAQSPRSPAVGNGIGPGSRAHSTTGTTEDTEDTGLDLDGSSQMQSPRSPRSPTQPVRLSSPAELALPLGFGAVELFFAPLTVVSACAVAFSHGGNDVANAIGPFSAILAYTQNRLRDTEGAIPLYINVVGGLGIVVGLMAFGYRVMQTVGAKITKLSMSKAFSAQYGASVSILVATVLGLPISTTAVLVGAVIGVGLAEGHGRRAVDFRVVGRIVLAWFITLPCSGVVVAIIYLILVHAWKL